MGSHSEGGVVAVIIDQALYPTFGPLNVPFGAGEGPFHGNFLILYTFFCYVIYRVHVYNEE